MADNGSRAEGRGLFAGFLIIALLLCCGTPAWVAYTMWADPKTEAAMTAATSSYLDALRDGHPEQAYELLCGHDKREFPLQRWLSTRIFEDIESYRITDATIERPSEGATLYSVDAEIRYANGRVRPMRYWLSDERAGWRVCGENTISSP